MERKPWSSVILLLLSSSSLFLFIEAVLPQEDHRYGSFRAKSSLALGEMDERASTVKGQPRGDAAAPGRVKG